MNTPGTREKIIGNQWWKVCADCGKWVRINKWLLGDLHFCLTDDELSQRGGGR